jgi:hypothetical protein
LTGQDQEYIEVFHEPAEADVSISWKYNTLQSYPPIGQGSVYLNKGDTAVYVIEY